MKKLILSLMLMAISMVVSAQWSAGLDLRICPSDYENNRSLSSDIVVNYSFDLHKNFYLMPTVGFFYKKFAKITVDGSFDSPIWPDGDYYSRLLDWSYHTGFDVACVVGKKFYRSKGCWLLFTGPRYSYAYATWEFIKLNPSSLDWRIGAGYEFKNYTVSAKVDVGLLDIYPSDDWMHAIQRPSIVLGIARIFKRTNLFHIAGAGLSSGVKI